MITLPEVTLRTRDKQYVTRVKVLPFLSFPEIIMWGERFFLRETDAVYNEASIYCAVTIPEAQTSEHAILGQSRALRMPLWQDPVVETSGDPVVVPSTREPTNE